MDHITKKKEHINIGVKHYLNTKLKPKLSDVEEQSEWSYPLYVQVTVKGQTTRVKSMTEAYIPIKSFENFLQQYAVDILQECNILRRAVMSIEDINLPTFRLYSVETNKISYQLDKLVFNALHEKVHNLLSGIIRNKMIPLERIRKRADYDKFPAEAISGKELEVITEQYESLKYSYVPYANPISPSHSFNISDRNNILRDDSDDINFLSLLLSDYMPEFKEIRENFGPELWDFNSYIQKIKDVKDIYLITIDDWISGRFDDLFMEVWGNAEALRSIKSGMSHIIAEDKDIEKFFNMYKPYTTSDNEQ